jgi:DNA transformation protein and related proteins
VLLYAIEGALLDVHWNDLTPAHKAQLNGQLEACSARNKS